MPSAYTQNFYHTVFSTKHRANLIAPDLEQRLYPFIGGILRDFVRPPGGQQQGGISHLASRA